MEALNAWGTGSRPQRGISAMATGALTPLLGDVAGPLLGGTAGLIGGGMLFHLGWIITDALSKIPGHFAQVIAQNQALDIARAGLVGRASAPGQYSPVHAGTMTEAERARDERLIGAEKVLTNIFRRAGLPSDDKLAAEAVAAFEGLQLEANKLGGTSAQRDARLAQNAEHVRLAGTAKRFAGTGDIWTIANALREIDIGGPKASAAGMFLMDQPGVLKHMVDTERREKRRPDAMSDEFIGSMLKTRAEEAFKSLLPYYRTETAKQIFNAFDSMTQKVSAGPFQTAMKQWHLGTWIKEDAETVFGDKTKLSADEWTFIRWYQNMRQEGKSEAEALEAYNDRDPLIRAGRAVFGRPPPAVSPDRQRELLRAGEAYTGSLPGFIGHQAQPFTGLPMPLNPQFSFSSLAGFANKMQTEAGIQIDYQQRTADNTQKTVEILWQILSGFQKGTVVQDPTTGRIYSPAGNAYEASQP